MEFDIRKKLNKIQNTAEINIVSSCNLFGAKNNKIKRISKAIWLKINDLEIEFLIHSWKAKNKVAKIAVKNNKLFPKNTIANIGTIKIKAVMLLVIKLDLNSFAKTSTHFFILFYTVYIFQPRKIGPITI